MPLWTNPSLRRALAIPAGVEPRCYHLHVRAEGWGSTPDAHICARCGRDKGSGLGVQSLPSGSSFLDISLLLLRFFLILQIHFGLGHLIDLLTACCLQGWDGQADTSQSTRAGFDIWSPTKVSVIHFPPSLRFPLPHATKPGKTEPLHTVDATYSSSQ